MEVPGDLRQKSATFEVRLHFRVGMRSVSILLLREKLNLQRVLGAIVLPINLCTGKELSFAVDDSL